jgi:phosphoglycerate dehydrogenase-like enzyme
VGGKAIALPEFPRLRGIFKTGIGRDNVPEAEAARRGIRCGFPSDQTAAVIHEETANFSCHLILSGLYANAGDFSSWTKHSRAMLGVQRLLVVGAGNIGRRVAAKMSGFMDVATFDNAVDGADELEARIRVADCVSLHVPLTPETRGFMDVRRLGWMKDGALLVNTARGAIVSEDALYSELKAGRLRAAFDVFWQEPYAGKLVELPPSRFLRSPHIASTCNEFLSATASDFLAFLAGIENRRLEETVR